MIKIFSIRFEIKIKELTKLVNDPINEIDNQTNKFEEKRKDEKRNQIVAIYEDNIGTLRNLIPLSQIFDNKWLNKEPKIKKINEELLEKIERIKKDLEVINTLDSEFLLQIKDYYLRTFDISGALAEKARLEDQKKNLESFENKKPPIAIKLVIISGVKIAIIFKY